LEEYTGGVELNLSNPKFAVFLYLFHGCAILIELLKSHHSPGLDFGEIHMLENSTQYFLAQSALGLLKLGKIPVEMRTVLIFPCPIVVK
jgi:hypothetical protein